jgi:hypothetical protein
MTLMLFATGIALSVLLIAAYSRPFTGENSVAPELLKQVIASEATPSVRNSSLTAWRAGQAIPSALGQKRTPFTAPFYDAPKADI